MSERGPRVSCGNCIGACCQNFKASFSEEEVQHLEAAGTVVKTVIPALKSRFLKRNANWVMHPIKRRALVQSLTDDPKGQEFYNTEAQMLLAGEGLYSVEGRCGYLDENNRCSDYENRPAVCRGFLVGSKACLGARERFATEVVVEMLPTRNLDKPT